LADFEKLGATVVGISPDDINTLVRFQHDTAAPQRFVSDSGMSTARALGLTMTDSGDTFVKRQTLVIGKDGKVLFSVFDWSPLTNVNATLHWLQAHPQT